MLKTFKWLGVEANARAMQVPFLVGAAVGGITVLALALLWPSPSEQMNWQHRVALIETLAWPLIALVLLILLGPTIKRFLREAKVVTFKGAGFEASMNRDGVAAAAALGAAVHHKTNGGEQPKELPEIAPLIEKTSSPRPRRRLQRSTVLWVDDNSENNLYERRALEALGIHIDLTKDSQEALRKLSRKEYDLVISDMERPSGKQAGYELLKLVRDSGNSVPFIIYSGSNLPQYRLEAESRGAQGSTNDPHELFELSVDQLLR